MRCDYRQLQTNPINYPVEIRVVSQADVSTAQSAQDIADDAPHRLARSKTFFSSAPEAGRVRNEWQKESFQVTLNINPDRANLAGITNLDVANSATSALSGTPVTTLQDGDKNIPVVARLQMDERARLSDIQNLYVYSSSQNATKIPLVQISDIQQQHDDRTASCASTTSARCRSTPSLLPGHLASEITSVALPKLREFEKTMPPGYKITNRRRVRQAAGRLPQPGAWCWPFRLSAIYLALLFQFNNAIKPLLVFAAAPYGVAGAILGLWVMSTSFGFMAFLGIASLIGVIVSHVIVLFDFIEEMHAKGEPFEEAVIDAGIIRLRPVMITVGATVLALFPLAMHGGPLWQPLCYAQIGGLTVATFITLLMVPVLYSIFVLDLKILTWEKEAPEEVAPNTSPATAHD